MCGVLFEHVLAGHLHLQPSLHASRIMSSVLFYRTPMGGLGPRLLLELCAEGSESMGADRLLSPLPALALAEPVRLRT